MKLLRDFSELTEEVRHGAVAIGNFDGVHRGHARIAERLIAKAREVGGPAVVFTFDPHPVRLLRPHQAPPPLTWTERKAELLAGLGIDAMIAYPTDDALLSLTAEEFYQQIVCDALAAKALVEGPNFYFGRDRAGNVDVLRRLTSESGVLLDVVEPLKMVESLKMAEPREGDEPYVSSSRLRGLISEGRVDEARRMLTEPYRIRGMVTHGAARGAKIGFPTANVDAIDTLLPARGVYAGRGYTGGESWPAAINVGTNPTFGEHQFKVEAHLIGAQVVLYGQPLEVDFLARLRDIRPFDSVEELKAQLAQDVEAAREVVDAGRNRSRPGD